MIDPRFGHWIKYQLHLANIKNKEIAKEADLSTSMVVQFLRGVKGSERCASATAKVLGYKSFKELENAYKLKETA